MFTCRSCLQRHVRALLGDSVYQRVELRNTIVLHHASRAPGRSYSTTSRLHRNSLITGEGSKYEQSRPQSGAHKMQTTQHPIQKNWTSQRDPLVFASDVLDLLREDKFTEAHKAVQDASKYFRCTVSWNHLMNWQLSRGKVNGAIKSYNEVCSPLRILPIMRRKFIHDITDEETWTKAGFAYVYNPPKRYGRIPAL